MLKKTDYYVLARIIKESKSYSKKVQILEDKFGKKNSLSVLRQIYASMGLIESIDNEYLLVFKYLMNHFDLGCNILEIGGGFYPILATYIDSYQRKLNCGTITVIDPQLGVSKLGNIKLERKSFNFGDNISNYDLIISQAPCIKTDEVAAAAIEKQKEFFITLCNCVLDKYPNLVDYYYDDDNYDPIFEQIFEEMKEYNKYLNNIDFKIDCGHLFSGSYSKIKYFTGKKLIKK